MVDPDWANVPAAYRASRWHGLFADTPDEFRSSLSWCGRFAGITNAVNCYSETEDVVGNPKGQAPALTDPVWVVQESLNGAALVKSVNIWPWLHIGCEGGWGRNAHYPLWLTAGSMLWLSGLTREDVIEHPLFTPFRNETERMSSTNLFLVTDTAATAMVVDGSVTNNPVFNRGFSPMLSRSAAQDDQWLALAKYVPAVSSPLGGMLLREDIIENHDLNEGGESCTQSRCSCRANQDGNVPLMGIMSNIDRWPERDDYKNPIWKLNCQSEVSRRSRSHSRISSAQKRSSRVRIGSMVW